jgi:acyl-CoA dehydrogenase
MNEQQQLVQETCERILRDLCQKEVVDAAEAGHWPGELWQTLGDAGLTLAGIGEKCGGTGGDFSDSLTVIKAAAAFCAPLPLAETFIAARLLELCDGEVPAGPLTVAPGSFTLNGNHLTGSATAVAFARYSAALVVPVATPTGFALCVLPGGDIEISPAHNMAGEARDDVSVDCEVTTILESDLDLMSELRQLGAVTRVVMMTGALESLLELSVNYALERNQFGRAIAKFQAIQQQLAVLSGEVAASIRAAESVMVDEPGLTDIAVAKARVGESVSISAEIAHQVHGAMGYTREHQLNHRSRRLWCWRDEYENERYWQRHLGRLFIQGGADQLWPALTAV